MGFPLFHIYVSLRESNSHHSPFLFTVMTSQSGPTEIDPSIPHDIPAISSLWMIPSFHRFGSSSVTLIVLSYYSSNYQTYYCFLFHQTYHNSWQTHHHPNNPCWWCWWIAWQIPIYNECVGYNLSRDIPNQSESRVLWILFTHGLLPSLKCTHLYPNGCLVKSPVLVNSEHSLFYTDSKMQNKTGWWLTYPS